MDGSALTKPERSALLAGLLAATDRFDRLDAVLDRILDEGDDLTLVREVLLTVGYAAGFPRATGAVIALAKRCEAKGRPRPAFPEDTLAGGPEAHEAAGLRTSRSSTAAPSPRS
jgi:hypothetical protein